MKFFWSDDKVQERPLPPEYREWLNTLELDSDFINMNATHIVIYSLWKQIQELKK